MKSISIVVLGVLCPEGDAFHLTSRLSTKETWAGCTHAHQVSIRSHVGLIKVCVPKAKSRYRPLCLTLSEQLLSTKTKTGQMEFTSSHFSHLLRQSKSVP